MDIIESRFLFEPF
jgi:hypothetical protein